jgi:acetyl-CoA synthetase
MAQAHGVRDFRRDRRTGELLEWGRAWLEVTINEFYGQTECNLVVANNAAILAPRPGSMGRELRQRSI